MRRLVVLLALSVSLTACPKDFFDPTPGAEGTAATSVELIGNNIRMLEGEANAVRISFRPKDPSARLRIERSSSTGRVVACGLSAIADPLPPAERCLPDVPDGVRETITADGLGAIVLVREGEPITIDLRLSYEEGGRSFEIRFPSIATPPGASACKDNGCNPFFEVTPTRGGSFTATARWDGGRGKLELLEGRVLAKAFSSTGIPYRIAGTRTGDPPLSVTSHMNAPSEYALAITNESRSDIGAVRIEATWP
jgi:hypothetical protein